MRALEEKHHTKDTCDSFATCDIISSAFLALAKKHGATSDKEVEEEHAQDGDRQVHKCTLGHVILANQPRNRRGKATSYGQAETTITHYDGLIADVTYCSLGSWLPLKRTVFLQRGHTNAWKSLLPEDVQPCAT